MFDIILILTAAEFLLAVVFIPNPEVALLVYTTELPYKKLFFAEIPQNDCRFRLNFGAFSSFWQDGLAASAAASA
jgi:hypothetical protein